VPHDDVWQRKGPGRLPLPVVVVGVVVRVRVRVKVVVGRERVAAAEAVILFVIIGGVTLVQFMVARYMKGSPQ
jgi:predicted thioesterase